ncbi:MAG TPA: hypothetical protein VLM91_21730 [Candidatus Methylomirabilis sp.]|nr:hypothetical protein [Candidatus Methylomirabilis sp.]
MGVSSQHCGTALASLKVGRGSLRVAHRALMFQWQDGKIVIMWPHGPVPVKPRFPTPLWRHR